MKGAIESYEAAVEEAAEPKAMRNLAALLRDVRADLRGAERLYCRALTAEPGNEHGLEGLYKTLARMPAETEAAAHDPIGTWVEQQEQGGEWPGVAVMLFEWAMRQSIEARV